jgi:hypothetical protein
VYLTLCARVEGKEDQEERGAQTVRVPNVYLTCT